MRDYHTMKRVRWGLQRRADMKGSKRLAARMQSMRRFGLVRKGDM